MTTKTAHVPGPWTAEYDASEPGDAVITAKRGAITIANVHDHGASSLDHDSAECRANARLIAAAPEMLEALHRADAALSLLVASGNADRHDHSALADIRAALAKAEG